MEKIKVEKSKKGFPCIWERGGGFTNTGEATIIASKGGQPKKPIYIRRRGSLANDDHALIVLEVGDYIIEANHHRKDFEIEILEVLDFEHKGEEIYAVVEKVNCFNTEEWKWNAKLPAYIEAAVQAAIEKATCYHCRSPHYSSVSSVMLSFLNPYPSIVPPFLDGFLC